MMYSLSKPGLSTCTSRPVACMERASWASVWPGIMGVRVRKKTQRPSRNWRICGSPKRARRTQVGVAGSVRRASGDFLPLSGDRADAGNFSVFLQRLILVRALRDLDHHGALALHHKRVPRAGSILADRFAEAAQADVFALLHIQRTIFDIQPDVHGH